MIALLYLKPSKILTISLLLFFILLHQYMLNPLQMRRDFPPQKNVLKIYIKNDLFILFYLYIANKAHYKIYYIN
jgi:hypothetical protein